MTALNRSVGFERSSCQPGGEGALVTIPGALLVRGAPRPGPSGGANCGQKLINLKLKLTTFVCERLRG